MKVLSNWRSVRLWETQLERRLHREHSLRSHGLLIGSAMLLLMWGLSALQMHLGQQSLALRYAVTLGLGYAGYLALLRWWAGRLVAGRLVAGRAGFDAEVPDPALDLRHPDGSGQGRGLPGAGHAGSGGGEGGGVLSDAAGGALELVGSSDEGAVIVVPVVAIFLMGLAIAGGIGSLVLLYFGWDALLAVAVEVAFSYVSARAAVRMAREGWLTAAVRLTWKPLLGALACAVVLGALVDYFMPGVDSLPEAVRVVFRA